MSPPHHERTRLLDPAAKATLQIPPKPRRWFGPTLVFLASLVVVGGALVVSKGVATHAARAYVEGESLDTSRVFEVGVFTDVSERRAEVFVPGLEAPRTLPWQPVSLGRANDSSMDADDGEESNTNQPAPFGAVSGHGLHCDMRSMAWLFTDVAPEIPTAVFGARGSAVFDSKLASGVDSWLAGVADANVPHPEYAELLIQRLGFQAQAGDFAVVARAAGMKKFIALGESQSSAAALWAGVRLAEETRDAEAEARNRKAQASDAEGDDENKSYDTQSPGSHKLDSRPRLIGLILTLIPTMGEERVAHFNALGGKIANTFGSLENARLEMGADAVDCSMGYGCVPFAKYVAAKGSDLPSLELLRSLAPWFPPTLVLGDYADEPAHPVENGRQVAHALGARFVAVSTRAERESSWPGLVAGFVQDVGKMERDGNTVTVEDGDGDTYGDATSGDETGDTDNGDGDTSSPASRKFRRRMRSSPIASVPRTGDAYDTASTSLLLSEEQLRTSSQLCVGDFRATLVLEAQCASLTPGEASVWEAGREAREVRAAVFSAAGEVTDEHETHDEEGVVTVVGGDAFSPFYLRTGLDVDECVASGLPGLWGLHMGPPGGS